MPQATIARAFSPQCLLAEGEEGEEAEPERAHGVPVPAAAVDQDLTVLHALEDEEADDGSDETQDAGGEVHRVGAGNDEEGVAAAAAEFEGDSLKRELMPGEHLAGEEERTQHQGCDEPRQSAARGGLAQAEPLLHGVDGVEHVAAGDLDGDRAEQQDRGVEPEDARDGQGEPLVDVVAVGVEVAVALGAEEDTDDGDEEHQDRAEGEEEAEAIGGEALTGPATRAGGFVPVIVVAATAGALEVAAIGWAPAMAAVVFLAAAGTAFEIGGRDDGRHNHLAALAMGRAY